MKPKKRSQQLKEARKKRSREPGPSADPQHSYRSLSGCVVVDRGEGKPGRPYSMSLFSASPSVLVTRSDIPKEAILLLESKCTVDICNEPKPVSKDELLKRIKGKNALYCVLTDRINKEVLEAAGSSLKVIATMSVGFDHIDIDECKKRGIFVGNTPEVLTDATAELTVTLLLATARRLMEASKEVTNGGWEKCVWGPLFMCGTSLVGSTVGVVGLGRIGSAVAERLVPFKVKNFLYCGLKAEDEVVKKLNAKYVEFDELIKESDFVVCCCALNPETKGLFNLKTFQNMKPNCILINTSRGPVVNLDDLHTALTTGLIKAAGLDVMDPEPLPTDHKLTKLPNCLLLPHIASATVETRTSMAVLAAKNVLAGLEGKPLPCPV